MNKLRRVGVDLAKNVFQLHGVDKNEKAKIGAGSLQQQVIVIAHQAISMINHFKSFMRFLHGLEESLVILLIMKYSLTPFSSIHDMVKRVWVF